MIDKVNLTSKIKEKARELGFLDCGIARAGKLEEDGTRLDSWLNEKKHAGMSYMERNIHERKDPRMLVEGARSIVLVLLNYFPNYFQKLRDAPVISKYAYSNDYHFVMKSKLNTLLDFIKLDTPGALGRVFVDSAPVMERAWAREAGLGWIGKNSLLLNKHHGSFFFIGEVIIDQELSYDAPTSGTCGLCRLCMEACPTGAITSEKIVDSNLCIAYHTIENKNDHLPENLKGRFKNRLFGCDICQDVCPWNRKNTFSHQHPDLKPIDQIIEWGKTNWESMEKKDFAKIFKHSPMKRTGFKRIKRNLDFLG